MPSEHDHIVLANKNHATLEYLLKDPAQFSEWIVTVAFYKAVHVVEAVFVHQAGKHCSSHPDRLQRLKNYHPDIFRHFRILWSASTIARYLHDCESGRNYGSFQDYAQPDRVVQQFIQKRLRSVEQLAVSKLSDRAKGLLTRVA